MRKFLTILLSLSMVLTIAACTQSKSDDDNNEEEEIEDTVNTDDVETEEGGEIADTEDNEDKDKPDDEDDEDNDVSDDENSTQPENEGKDNTQPNNENTTQPEGEAAEQQPSDEDTTQPNDESGNEPNVDTSFEPEDLPPDVPHGNDDEGDAETETTPPQDLPDDTTQPEYPSNSQGENPSDSQGENPTAENPSDNDNGSTIPEPPLEDDPGDGVDIIESEPSQLTEILDSIMVDIDSDSLPATLARIPIEEGMFEYYTFIPYEEGFDGLVYEPMMSSIPWSVVLVSVPADKDAKEVAKEIKQNADPRKWICVEADFVETYANDNIVLLIMVDDGHTAVAEKMAENFMNLNMEAFAPHNLSSNQTVDLSTFRKTSFLMD